MSINISWDCKEKSIIILWNNSSKKPDKKIKWMSMIITQQLALNNVLNYYLHEDWHGLVAITSHWIPTTTNSLNRTIQHAPLN
jgi:hypothetical protein